MLLPPANEVCEGYVFTPVCQSFCSPGGMLSRLARGSPGPHPGGCPDPHLGGCIPACTKADTPQPPTKQTGTAAGGAHPTGMHSCFVFLSGPLKAVRHLNLKPHLMFCWEPTNIYNQSISLLCYTQQVIMGSGYIWYVSKGRDTIDMMKE